jgi:hypothetical protein
MSGDKVIMGWQFFSHSYEHLLCLEPTKKKCTEFGWVRVIPFMVLKNRPIEEIMSC